MRATKPRSRMAAPSLAAARASSSSPYGWPWASLMRLKSSMSSSTTENGRPLGARPVELPGERLLEAAVVGELCERVAMGDLLEPAAMLL